MRKLVTFKIKCFPVRTSKGKSYLAEHFHEMTRHLSEHFRQIKQYLVGQLRKITQYLVEHHVQKNHVCFA